MHLILTGSTGLVGSGVLAYILSVPNQVTKLSILSRKPVPLAEGHPQVEVIQHSDFGKYPPEVLEKLKGAEGCIWALGISQAEVDAEEYVKITKDYTLAAAEAFSGLQEPFKFVYVSGEGATLNPGMFTPIFGRVKGETEAALLAMHKKKPSFKPYSLRPAIVDAKDQPEIHSQVYSRSVPFSIKATRAVLGPVIRVAVPSMVSPTRELGKVLTELAMSNGEALQGTGITGDGRTGNNKAFRRLAGLSKA